MAGVGVRMEGLTDFLAGGTVEGWGYIVNGKAEGIQALDAHPMT